MHTHQRVNFNYWCQFYVKSILEYLNPIYEICEIYMKTQYVLKIFNCEHSHTSPSFNDKFRLSTVTIYCLTHCGPITPYAVIAYRMFSTNQILNQWLFIVNWTLRNKLLLHFRENTIIFIQVNALENVVCKISVNMLRPYYVKYTEFA